MEAPKIEDASNDNETFAPEYRDRLRTWLEKMINRYRDVNVSSILCFFQSIEQGL